MAQPTNQEVEAKFAILDPAQATRLCDTPTLTAAFALQTAKTVSHLDTYLDTPAYHLLRAGYALRLRQTADGYLATLKGLPLDDEGPIHRRVELEAPLPVQATPLDLAQWPNQIREFVTGVLGADPDLQPLCTLRQTRQKRLVAAQNGKTTLPPFAELSIDQVTIFWPALSGPAAPDAEETAAGLLTFWEAEAELLPGQDEEQLAGLVRKLQRLRGLQPNRQSKLERALEEISQCLVSNGQIITAFQPEMHTADACRLIWQRQLLRMVRNEAGVRHSHDIEYIHDMRVAVRRARVAMTLFTPYFRRKPLRTLRQMLRTTGRKLGAVRDLDVALDKLRRHQKKTAAADAADFQGLLTHWQEQRAAAFAELLTWLDSADYADFLRTFARFCRKAGKGAKRPSAPGEPPEPLQVRHVLPSMLLARFERVRAYETLFSAEQAPPIATLHQLRIECKFLRYNLEFAQHLLGPPGRRLIGSLKEFQEHLGDLNDAAVSAGLLQRVPTEIANDALHHYCAGQQALLEELRQGVQPNLAQFVALDNRRLLLQALVRL